MTEEEQAYLRRYYTNLSAEKSPEEAREIITINAMPERLDEIIKYLETLSA